MSDPKEPITQDDVEREYEEHPEATPLEHVYNLVNDEADDE